MSKVLTLCVDANEAPTHERVVQEVDQDPCHNIILPCLSRFSSWLWKLVLTSTPPSHLAPNMPVE